jgi:lambda family phage portal protein
MSKLERMIGWAFPSWGANRAVARARLNAVERLGAYPQSEPGRRDGEVRARGASPDWTLELQYDRRKVVDRSRELERTNVLAEGLLSRSTESVVGDGFPLQMDSGDEAFDDEVEARWNDWCENDADYRKLLTFSDILGILYRSKMRDGDVGAVLMADGSLRIVESDEIASPTGSSTTPNMVDGIELDRAGRPIAFHVFDWDPNVHWSDRRQALTRLVRVPAEQVVFLARRLRAGQTRGMTAFVNLFWILEQVMDSIEAVTVAMRMAACFGLLIKQHGPMVNLQTGTDSSGRTKSQLNLEPGMFKRLEPGEEIEQIQPLHPGSNFDNHVQGLIRLAGIPFGLPLEVVLRDFTKSNFSNTRAAMLQAWHTWRRHQDELKRVCSKIFMWKLLNWYPGLSPEQCKHSWQAPGWAWIDPVAEVQSAMLSIDAGFDSPQRVISRMGGDWKAILKERKEWNEKLTAEEINQAMSNLSRDPPVSIEDQVTLLKAKPALAGPGGGDDKGGPPTK